MKLIEWEEGLKLGTTIYRIIPPTLIPYTVDYFMPIIIDDTKEAILFNRRFNVAPKLLDTAIEKAKRHGWKYYTMKKYPGAIILLGSK